VPSFSLIGELRRARTSQPLFDQYDLFQCPLLGRLQSFTVAPARRRASNGNEL